MKRWLQHALMMAALAGVICLGTGCETPDPDNASARPWNSPTGWEHGLPTGLNEGR